MSMPTSSVGTTTYVQTQGSSVEEKVNQPTFVPVTTQDTLSSAGEEKLAEMMNTMTVTDRKVKHDEQEAVGEPKTTYSVREIQEGVLKVTTKVEQAIEEVRTEETLKAQHSTGEQEVLDHKEHEAKIESEPKVTQDYKEVQAAIKEEVTVTVVPRVHTDVTTEEITFESGGKVVETNKP